MRRATPSRRFLAILLGLALAGPALAIDPPKDPFQSLVQALLKDQPVPEPPEGLTKDQLEKYKALAQRVRSIQMGKGAGDIGGVGMGTEFFGTVRELGMAQPGESDGALQTRFSEPWMRYLGRRRPSDAELADAVRKGQALERERDNPAVDADRVKRVAAQLENMHRRFGPAFGAGLAGSELDLPNARDKTPARAATSADASIAAYLSAPHPGGTTLRSHEVPAAASLNEALRNPERACLNPNSRECQEITAARARAASVAYAKGCVGDVLKCGAVGIVPVVGTVQTVLDVGVECYNGSVGHCVAAGTVGAGLALCGAVPAGKAVCKAAASKAGEYLGRLGDAVKKGAVAFKDARSDRLYQAEQARKEVAKFGGAWERGSHSKAVDDILGANFTRTVSDDARKLHYVGPCKDPAIGQTCRIEYDRVGNYFRVAVERPQPGGGVKTQYLTRDGRIPVVEGNSSARKVEARRQTHNLNEDLLAPETRETLQAGSVAAGVGVGGGALISETQAGQR